MPHLLLPATIATIIAVLGGLLGVLFHRFFHGRLSILVYAAMALLFSVTVFDILPEAKEALPWSWFIVAILSGYLLFYLIGSYVADICPACAVKSVLNQENAGKSRPIALILIAVAVHSTMDGIAVVTNHSGVGRPDMYMLAGVAVHKLPEGIALALLFVGMGYKPLTAFFGTFALELTTIIGATLGLFALREAPAAVIGAVFAHVGGGFMYLVQNTFTPPTVKLNSPQL